MEIFKRISNKSKIEILTRDNDHEYINTLTNFEKIYGGQILQMSDFNDFLAIEYVEWGNDMAVTEPPIDYQKNEYLDEIINFDPFGGKYTKQPIKTIFENGDTDWLNRALREMKNEYIKCRLDYIVKHGGFGKIRGVGNG